MVHHVTVAAVAECRQLYGHTAIISHPSSFQTESRYLSSIDTVCEVAGNVLARSDAVQLKNMVG